MSKKRAKLSKKQISELRPSMLLSYFSASIEEDRIVINWANLALAGLIVLGIGGKLVLQIGEETAPEEVDKMKLDWVMKVLFWLGAVILIGVSGVLARLNIREKRKRCYREIMDTFAIPDEEISEKRNFFYNHYLYLCLGLCVSFVLLGWVVFG
jgi:hypothetical protein